MSVLIVIISPASGLGVLFEQPSTHEATTANTSHARTTLRIIATRTP